MDQLSIHAYIPVEYSPASPRYPFFGFHARNFNIVEMNGTHNDMV